jgi:hypothetical protein
VRRNPIYCQTPRTTVLSLVLLMWIAVPRTRAQQIPDLSGNWSLDGGRPNNSITITQADGELRIEGQTGLFEGTGPYEIYKLDGSRYSYVQNFGAWWRKAETQLAWEGEILTMKLKVRSGWWKALRPEQELLERPHGDITRTIKLEASGTVMTIDTLVINGDPPPDRLKSREVFRRYLAH